MNFGLKKKKHDETNERLPSSKSDNGESRHVGVNPFSNIYLSSVRLIRDAEVDGIKISLDRELDAPPRGRGVARGYEQQVHGLVEKAISRSVQHTSDRWIEIEDNHSTSRSQFHLEQTHPRTTEKV